MSILISSNLKTQYNYKLKFPTPKRTISFQARPCIHKEKKCNSNFLYAIGTVAIAIAGLALCKRIFSNKANLSKDESIDNFEHQNIKGDKLSEKIRPVVEIAQPQIKSQGVNEISEFVQSLIGKNLPELNAIQDSIYKERCIFYKEVNPDRKSYEDISFTQEQRQRESFINKKLAILDNKIKDSKDCFYNELLVTPNDKQIKVPVSNQYLNSEEESVFDMYYDNYPYNHLLREGKDLSQIRSIQLMDSAFEKAPATTEEYVVYRGVHGHPVKKSLNKFIDSIQEGVIIKDPSYISTSIDSTNAQFRQFASAALDGNGVILKIRLPKGTKGVLGGYREFVLPRNSSIKINKIELIDGVKVADAEYILP